MSTELRALIYSRASSDPTGRGLSVDSQETENRRFCERQGWRIVAAISDNDRSASRYATRVRDGYAEARRRIRTGEVDVFVCWEASRADRDLAAYAKFRDLCVETGVKWAYSGRIYDMSRTDDRFATGLDALLAEREAAVIRDRVERGIRSNAAKGRPHGTIPYGYMRTHDPRTGVTLDQVRNPDTAPVVAEVVARVLAGDTLYAILADLNLRGVPTPQAYKERQLDPAAPPGVWGTAMLRRLLGSQSMTGVRTHRGVPHPKETWEPIVSASEWAAVQAILADPHRARHHRGVTPRHLLSGVATCGECGAWLRAASNRGRPVYQCAGHGAGDLRGKGHVSRGPREVLDAFVVARTVARLADPALGASMAAREADTRDRGAQLRVELDMLRERMTALEARSRLTTVRTAAESFERMVLGLAEEIERRESELRHAIRLPAAVVDLACPDAASLWGSPRVQGDIELQRQVIRALFRVVVHRSGQPRGARGFDPDTVDVIAL